MNEKGHEPNLGLATTRELLDEIRARIEVDGRLDYRTVDGDEQAMQTLREAVKAQASHLDLLDSVTRNCRDAFDDNAFLDGFEAGLKPLLLDNVRVWGVTDQDLTLFCLGAAQVALTGQEQVQATDRTVLGHAKGVALRELATAAMGEAIARHER